MQISKILSFHLLRVLLLLATKCVSSTFFHPARLGFPHQHYSSRNAQGLQQITPNFSTRYYTQTVDHFSYNPESYTTFQQRYLMSSDYWGGADSSSPIIAYMGAEAPIVGQAAFGGFFVDLASRFNALLVYIEHRYYGTSVPFGSEENEWSQNTSTLGYFSSTQALADYAELIIDLKKNLSAETCPVIVVGGSYGGMLASWFRLKYPHVAIGAYAASAPILYFENLTPHDGYDRIVSYDFKSTSESCYNSIRNSWFEMDDLAAKPNGLLSISKLFNTCSPLNSTDGLKANLEMIYDSTAQYDTPWTDSVGELCNAVDKLPRGTDDMVRVATAINETLFQWHRKAPCSPFPDHNQQSNQSGWLWQTCTEMVMPMGRGPNDTMFQAAPFDMKNYTKMCQHLYGLRDPYSSGGVLFNISDTVVAVFTEMDRTHWYNNDDVLILMQNIKSVLGKFASNIIFTNGLRDPYSSGGVLFNISDSVVAVYTEMGN